MDLTAQDREKLKNIQMELLKDFIAVCEKLGLRYYAIGGTALGVVRHGGYIPWDDDIDVAMMREDYEIFLKEGQSLLKDGYFLQTFDTDGFVIWTLMMIFATVALVWAAHHKNLVRIFAGEEHATSFFKKKKKKA